MSPEPLSVHSEIGRLRRVLVHAPGPEVDSMPPSMMEELLFDDILYGPRARHEHHRFRAILEKLGVEVEDTRDLLDAALQAAAAEIPALLEDIGQLEGLGRATIDELARLAPLDLGRALVHGLAAPADELAPDYLFRLTPLANLLFSRDAQVVMADGVIIGSMSRRARQREPLLSRFIFRHCPRLKTSKIHADYCRRLQSGAWPQKVSPTLEGGDVLIFHEGVLLVGVSERTTERAVDQLAATLRDLRLFRSLIMVPLPRARTSMHLDTVFTRTSENECLVYPPLVLPGGPETLSVIRIDLERPDDWGRREPSLLEALRNVGVDLQPICCGGPDDYIRQMREQWTDGANSFAISPGVVMIYSRNAATAAELEKHGYHIVSAADMPFGRDGDCRYEFIEGKKYAILVAGGELSRARGGPRCMTMPLVRDAV